MLLVQKVLLSQRFPLKPDYSGVVKTAEKYDRCQLKRFYPSNTKYVNLDRLKSLSLLPHCSWQNSQRQEKVEREVGGGGV